MADSPYKQVEDALKATFDLDAALKADGTLGIKAVLGAENYPNVLLSRQYWTPESFGEGLITPELPAIMIFRDPDILASSPFKTRGTYFVQVPCVVLSYLTETKILDLRDNHDLIIEAIDTLLKKQVSSVNDLGIDAIVQDVTTGIHLFPIEGETIFMSLAETTFNVSVSQDVPS